MSYGRWKVDEEATVKEFGYQSKELTKGSNKPVKCVCEDCGIKANKRFRESQAKHICKSIIDGKKKCFKCRKLKPIEDFSKNRSAFDGHQKCCKECFSNYDSVQKGYKKKTNAIKNDLDVYLRNKTSGLERKCKDKNLSFDLEKDYLLALYKRQNGKCYYSGLEIKHNIGCHQYDSISVERLDPNKGYIKDNIVLASFAVNSFKGMMTEDEFKKYLLFVIPRLISYAER